MINFFICSDNLLYRTKVEDIINKYMKKEKISYSISNKIDINIENKKIYIYLAILIVILLTIYFTYKMMNI